MCLVSTVYDVFRRLPLARTVVPVDSSEREQANGRGRNAGCPAPPAQIRTCRITAYGSYLG